ncbi:uncharacterized protein RBU33_021623 [Hipposideros larvatus]
MSYSSELQQQRQLKKQSLAAKGHLLKLWTVNQRSPFRLMVPRKYNLNVHMCTLPRAQRPSSLVTEGLWGIEKTKLLLSTVWNTSCILKLGVQRFPKKKCAEDVTWGHFRMHKSVDQTRVYQGESEKPASPLRTDYGIQYAKTQKKQAIRPISVHITYFRVNDGYRRCGRQVPDKGRKAERPLERERCMRAAEVKAWLNSLEPKDIFQGHLMPTISIWYSGGFFTYISWPRTLP